VVVVECGSWRLCLAFRRRDFEGHVVGYRNDVLLLLERNGKVMTSLKASRAELVVVDVTAMLYEERSDWSHQFATTSQDQYGDGKLHRQYLIFHAQNLSLESPLTSCLRLNSIQYMHTEILNSMNQPPYSPHQSPQPCSRTSSPAIPSTHCSRTT